MDNKVIPRENGRKLFGTDPEKYHRARPAYPDWVFETIQNECLTDGNSKTFEIGAGTGLATKRLMEMGATPMTAIEPDLRLAQYLKQTLQCHALHVLSVPFEDISLSEKSFDLGVCATAFHWLDERPALRKIADLLRPGGWWVMVWNVFGDNIRPDAFHERTKDLLYGYQSPGEGTNSAIPFGLDVESRLSSLKSVEAFGNVQHFVRDWEIVLSSRQVSELYASFSNINANPNRGAILRDLESIASRDFDGKVIRNMSTSLYLARRS
ncbi:class I SAM-dependent methyltransferase [Dyadobacter sp. CY107]|uniref:class I SAM-dependent methyltransferase n=1 Tax=Dyadobacter fanqingshengii TaxID=2906443 RepID=UPI001F4455B6|nr:class I SAM-dependent methyltransferase [Dyadobacter fanqingshengii]MCF2506071.1 class I SAM-dependent methyltransferase [Dyadobacter fanqingshengii]